MNPDCRDGKHRACAGDGWDFESDRLAACPCSCHAVLPRRVQMSRKHPWRGDNPEAVIVARPSKWGNPFVVGLDGPDGAAVVALFRRWIASDRSAGRARHIPPTTAEIRADLAGKDLACWCSLDQPCHADVLLELANPKSLDPRVMTSTEVIRVGGPDAPILGRRKDAFENTAHDYEGDTP